MNPFALRGDDYVLRRITRVVLGQLIPNAVVPRIKRRILLAIDRSASLNGPRLNTRFAITGETRFTMPRSNALTS